MGSEAMANHKRFQNPSRQRPMQTGRAWRSGVAATEFAFAMPLTLALILLTLGIAIRATDDLFAAALAPQDARDRAVAAGLPGNHLSVTLGINTPGSSPSATCSARVETMTLSSSLVRAWPAIGWIGDQLLMGPLTSQLRATATVYVWEFQPGFEGNCQ